MTQNHENGTKKSTFKTIVTGGTAPENTSRAGEIIETISEAVKTRIFRTAEKPTRCVIDAEHPVYKTKMLVVSGCEPDFDYSGYARTKIKTIAQYLPIHVPRSIVAILFALIIIPAVFSPGIFVPDFSIAAGDMVASQFKFPETVFKNLNFDSRASLKSQIDHMIASYQKKLDCFDKNEYMAKMLNARIQIAQAIYAGATDDMFLDFMMEKLYADDSRLRQNHTDDNAFRPDMDVAQVENIKVKPYFSYSNPSFRRDRKMIETRTVSLGKWAVRKEREDLVRQADAFMAKYPELFQRANEDRLENVLALVEQSIAQYSYVPVEAVSTVTVEVPKKVKKVKKHRARRAKKSVDKAAAPKAEKKQQKSEAPAAAAETPAAPAPAPVEAPAAPAPAPAETPNKDAQAVPAPAENNAPANVDAMPAPPAPEPAPDASMQAPPAPAEAPKAEEKKDEKKAGKPADSKKSAPAKKAK